MDDITGFEISTDVMMLLLSVDLRTVCGSSSPMRDFGSDTTLNLNEQTTDGAGEVFK